MANAPITLLSMTPNGTSVATGAAANTKIVFTFSSAIQAGTGQIQVADANGQFLLNASVTGPLVTISGNTLTLDPGTLPFGTQFFVTLPSGIVTSATESPYVWGVGLAFCTSLSPTPLNWTGTSGADFMHGSNFADTLNGGPGRDQLFGENGDDILNGGDEASGTSSGDGVMSGDHLWGGDGNDILNGGGGDDYLSGGNGNDSVYGGSGNDVLSGASDGDDLLDGGDGNDTLSDFDDNGSMFGGAGDDDISARGTLTSASIDGGSGNDIIYASDSNKVVGGTGDDRIYIEAASRLSVIGSVDGGAGNDLIDVQFFGTKAALTVSGGAGIDTFVFHPTIGDPQYSYTIADFQAGSGGDKIDVEALIQRYSTKGTNPFTGSGILTLTQSGADTLLTLHETTAGSVRDVTLVRLANVSKANLTPDNFVGAYVLSKTPGLVLNGGNGADTLRGGTADDTLNGGDGPDMLYGNEGNDTLIGGSDSGTNDNDFLDGGAGDDILQGGAGNDWLTGGAGNDILDGGPGNDTISDYEDNCTIFGGAGDDSIEFRGFNGAANIDAGSGDDSIKATDNCTVIGGEGNDRIYIQASSTPLGRGSIDAGSGNDLIDVQFYNYPSSLLASGGAGVDTYVLHQHFGQKAQFAFVITDFQVGRGGDKIDVDALISRFSNFGSNPFAANGIIALTQMGNDTWLVLHDPSSGKMLDVNLVILANVKKGDLTADNFVGNYAPNGSTQGQTINGTSGADTLIGTTLDDTINGGDGADTLYGKEGNDTLIGGSDNAVNDNDTLDGGAGNDILKGGAGNDQLTGGTGDDTLEGGTGNDMLRDDAGNNILRGGDGNDTISNDGGAFDSKQSDNAVIEGGAGDDQISVRRYGRNFPTISVDGGSGDDTIRLWLTTDAAATITITGGPGKDTFAFDTSYSGQQCVITDFVPGSGDKIDVLKSLPVDTGGNPFGSGAFLKAVQVGGDTILSIDEDGAAGSRYSMQQLVILKGVNLSQLTAADFVGGLAPNGIDTGVTLNGTGGNDILTGGALDDTLNGGAGNDQLNGEGGNDILNGGDEDGAGQGDTLRGGVGKDTLNGGAGQDKLYGDAGDDRLNGDAGNDVLDGGSGNDTLDGGDGNDTLSDSAGNNILLGGAGDDRLTALGSSTDNNRLEGGAGNDILEAGGGNDYLDGGAGDDQIHIFNTYARDKKAIVAYGGEGNDTFEIGSSSSGSAAVLSGGDGSDRYVFSGSGLALTITDFSTGSGGDVIDLASYFSGTLSSNPFGPSGYARLLQSGADTLLQVDLDGNSGSANAFETLITLKNVEASKLLPANFTFGMDPQGSNAGMTIMGSAGSDVLTGGFLDDRISGGDGNDEISGGKGNDLLSGGNGNDGIYGGSGSDVLDGNDGNDVLYGDGDNDTLNGGGGDDLLIDDAGDNVFNGGDGADRLSASGSGRNRLDGGSGNDELAVGRGDSEVFGGLGDDKLSVNFGNNYDTNLPTSTILLNGGDGKDSFQVAWPINGRAIDVRATGGAGIDTYQMQGVIGNGTYAITDFSAGIGGDRIDLLGLLPANYDGLNPFAAGGMLRLVPRGADVAIQFDADGASGPKPFQDVVVLQNVLASALVGDNFVGGMSPDGASAGLTYSGTEDNDQLKGNFLDNTVLGFGGNDVLDGLNGNDMLDGGIGDDSLSGGAGNDTLVGAEGNDRLIDSLGNNHLDGGAGNDNLYASGGGRNIMDGGDGDDIITLEGGNGSIEGGAGADRIVLVAGGPIGDVAHLVTANGGAGDDKISIEMANNPAETTFKLDGGSGADQFLLAPVQQQVHVQIAGFNAAEGDRLSLGPVSLGSVSTDPLKINPFELGVLALEQSGNDTLIKYDLNGKAASNGVTVATLLGVNVASVDNTYFREGVHPNSLAAVNLKGTVGNDQLMGTSFNDTLAGGSGNDRLYGLGGNDTLHGNEGIDGAFFVGPRANYTVTLGSDNLISVSGIDGVDTLDGIERLVFTDGYYSFDINGAAGQVYRLYQAAFGRTPDARGFGYWINNVEQGESLYSVASSFVKSSEFKKLYGENVSNGDFLKNVYQNILHREPDQAGFDWWKASMDHGDTTQAMALAGFSQDKENTAALVGVMQLGMKFIPVVA